MSVDEDAVSARFACGTARLVDGIEKAISQCRVTRNDL